MWNELTSVDGLTALKVVAILVPVLMLFWIILTVTALHKRNIYLWELGSTWVSIIACPIAVVIMSFGSWGTSHDTNVATFQAPIIAGAILYVGAFAYVVFYNFNKTRSTLLAVSTSMLQQLAVLGVIFLFLRWHAEKVNKEQR